MIVENATGVRKLHAVAMILLQARQAVIALLTVTILAVITVAILVTSK